MGDLSSQIRDTLLGLARVISFVEVHAAAWMVAKTKTELETSRHDVRSLSDYDAHLLNKVQPLVDTTLGLINIQQNNIIKVSDSRVGGRRTVDLGCQHVSCALVLTVLSAVLPILWFRWRGGF